MVGNSHIVAPHKVIKAAEGRELHSTNVKTVINYCQSHYKVNSPGRSDDDDVSSRKRLPEDRRRVVEIEFHVALRVTVVFHHFWDVLNVAAKVNDRCSWAIFLVVVGVADQRRTEYDVVCAIRVSLDAVEADRSAVRDMCVGRRLR